MRLLTLFAAFIFCLPSLDGATLERLSLDDMIEKSTEIVQGRVLSSRAGMRKGIIYTYSQIEVLERWKGAVDSRIEVAVPGGSLGALRQTFSGTPRLVEGSEYVLFLWTGTSGVTQVIGLSQGVFDLKRNAEGETVVERAASKQVILDPKTGRPVRDEAVLMRLGELRTRIERTLAAPRR